MTDPAIWLVLQSADGRVITQFSVPRPDVPRTGPVVVIAGTRVFSRWRGRVYREADAYWAPALAGEG